MFFLLPLDSRNPYALCFPFEALRTDVDDEERIVWRLRESSYKLLRFQSK